MFEFSFENIRNLNLRNLTVSSLSSRIEEELGDKARFAGKNFRHPIWAGLAPLGLCVFIDHK